MEGHGDIKRFKKSDPNDTLNSKESNNNIMDPTTKEEEQQQVPQNGESSTSSPKVNGATENGNGALILPHEEYPSDPLLVPNVLISTFQNLSTTELKRFRLVNKVWERAATQILQEKLSPVVFSDEIFDADKMLKITEIFTTCLNQDPPYIKFEIASKFLTLGNQDLITQFFQVCSKFMETLIICTNRNFESCFTFAKDFGTSITLPKLKSLVFEDDTQNGTQTYNNEFTQFFKNVISASTNLERLDLSFRKRYFEPEEGLEEQGEIPDGIICSRSSQNLQHLEISAKLTDDQLLCLSKSGLKLRTLHFRVKNVYLMESSFTKLLESQSETLLELKLTEERHGSNFLIKFPKMNKLEKIIINSICEFENSVVTFAPFGYQQDLPKLETLVLWNCFGKEERWSQFFLAQSPSLTMSRLELPTQFRNSSIARSIHSVFPYLKKLKIGFSLRPENEEVMRQIFETMESLEELDIRTDMDEMNENIDHVLTGIPKTVCKQIRQNNAYFHPLGLEVERSASLVDLKNLKRLDIVLDNNRAPFITDVTGYLTLLKMPKLKYLRFTRYGMSQQCVDHLLEKYKVEFIPAHGRNFFEVEYINFEDFE